MVIFWYGYLVDQIQMRFQSVRLRKNRLSSDLRLFWRHQSNITCLCRNFHWQTLWPRVERPLCPNDLSRGFSAQTLHEWHMFMESEVRNLGEVLQRHSCKPVCHNTEMRTNAVSSSTWNRSQSHFDSDSNSVVLKCLDGMVNYFNRLLVYCRHNHDINHSVRASGQGCHVLYTDTSPKWM